METQKFTHKLLSFVLKLDLLKPFFKILIICCALAVLSIFTGYYDSNNLTSNIKNYKRDLVRWKKIPSFYENYFYAVKNLINVDKDLDHIFKKELKIQDLSQNWKNAYYKTFGRNPPLNFEKWLAFAKKKNCPLHPLYYWQIDTDLKPFRTSNGSASITSKMINDASKIHPNIGVLILTSNQFRYAIQTSNETNYKSSYLKKLYTPEVLSVLPAGREIKMAINFHYYPRVLLHDQHKNKQNTLGVNKCLFDTYNAYKQNTGYLLSNSKIETTNLLPLFSSCKTTCHKDILLPSYHHLVEVKNFVMDRNSWEQKSLTLLWRGATTSIGWRKLNKFDNFSIFQRARLVKWAKNMNRVKQNNQTSSLKLPVNIDIGFSRVVNCLPQICDFIKKNYIIKPPVTNSDHFKYKYLLTIDGHSWVSKFQSFLFGKSLIFQSTYFIEWFSFLTRPWYHYVPVDLSLNDIEENIWWTYTYDFESKKIAERANKLALKHLKLEHMQCYASLLTLEYASLLK